MEKTVRFRILSLGLIVGVLLAVEFVAPLRQSLAPLTSRVFLVESFLYRARRSTSRWVETVVLGVEQASIFNAMVTERTALFIDRARLANLQEENDNLKSLLKFSEESKISLVAARVIGQDPLDPSAILRLNVGRDRGVESGAAVLGPEGMLIGIIDKVGANISTVQLLVSRRTQIPVRVLGKSQSFGLLQSSDGLALIIDQVPKDEPLSSGDVVVTSLGRSGVPPNIIVGRILSVIAPPESLWQRATVVSDARSAVLDTVAVVSDPIDQMTNSNP